MDNILINKNEKIATITINRPSKLNALNKVTIQELHDAFVELNADTNIKIIILTGSGNKAFVAGADISEFADFDASQATTLSKTGQKLLFDFIENLNTPVIAAINGFALGGGLELAMACHFRIASDTAKMGLPEVSLGVIPGYGGTQRLPQLVGKGKAMELIMSASMLNAEEAKNYGLVNYVVSQDELLPLCEKLASKISRNSSTAISAAIKAINANFDNSKNGYAIEIEQFGKCFGSKDFTEGTIAFLEKRKPNFK